MPNPINHGAFLFLCFYVFSNATKKNYLQSILVGQQCFKTMTLQWILFIDYKRFEMRKS
jgi:hypothetical protein